MGTGWFVWDGITIYREMREGEWAIPIQSVNMKIFNHELIELINLISRQALNPKRPPNSQNTGL